MAEQDEDKIPPVFDDEPTRKKIEKHLSDINDEITEEDIRNVKTNPDPYYEKPLDESDEEDKIPPVTPWNILDSDG